MPTLKLAKVSRASAIQRAGRAGRTRAGRCLRLYTKGDFDGRPTADTPEIRRSDLAEAVLALRASGVTSPSTFPFFEAPPQAALTAADTLLQRLGAIAPDGTLSSTGERMLRFPLHPRQARLVIEAERRGIAREGAALAALVGERDIRMETRARLGPGGGNTGHRGAAGPSDLLELFDRLREGQATSARSAGLEPGAMQSVGRVQQQLQRLTDGRFPAPPDDATHERALLECILAGWPDRVARRRKPKAPELLLDGGVAATLEASSVVLEPEFVVAVDAEERKGGVVVRLASGIEPEWLLELFPEAIADHDALEWNAGIGRVDRVTRLSYGTLALDETRAPAPASEAATAVLAQAALAAGPAKFASAESLEHLKFRLALLRGASPEAGFPEFDDAFITRALLVLCEGRTRFDEIPEGALIDALTQSLTREQARLLASAAPDRVTLTNGRSVQVHYEPGKPAWIESRLQDFFGLGQGPAICGGRVPLVLHLLAPNMRAVQVTTDLAGFWERHYPAVRKELMRKYPRHAWPEDGRTAVPPPPKPPRPPRR
jgi:ATP-dependent helicase HrpB